MQEFDCIMVGAGPSGLAAAIFLRVDGWSTLILEKGDVGGQAGMAYIVSNYLGFPPGPSDILVDNMFKQLTKPPPEGLGAQLKTETVTKLDVDNKIVYTDKDSYKAKAILLATGGNMQKLNVPGEEKFLGKGVTYNAKKDLEHFTNKKVVVIGGGNSAIDAAVLAKTKTNDVKLVHRREILRANFLPRKRLERANIEVLYNKDVVEIRGDEKVHSIVLRDVKTKEESVLPVDWVVIAIGTVPNIELAKQAGLELSNGYVKINENFMTSKEGIFACGEIAGSDQHILTAAAHGALAGMAISRYLALEKLKRGENLPGAVAGKYPEEYMEMLKKS